MGDPVANVPNPWATNGQLMGDLWASTARPKRQNSKLIGDSRVTYGLPMIIRK